jgi:nucleoside-diphosphate-sugar epimerase
MARILILGASGFLAGHLIDVLRLDARVDQVTCVTRQTRYAPRLDTSRIGWLTFDAVSASVLELTELLEKVNPTSIVNCIGLTQGSADELDLVNVRYVRNLVQAIDFYRSASLVHLGSAAEYGIQPTGVPIRVNTALHPVAEYGRTKLSGSNVVADAAAAGAIRATVLRVFNPLGAGSPQRSLAGSIARNVQDALLNGKGVIESADLSDYRDFIDARDVATAIVQCAIGPKHGSTFLNVARGEAVQARELAHRLVAIAGFKGELREQPRVGPLASLVTWQAADIWSTTVELAWTPTHSLDEALHALWGALERSDRSAA